jgi:hypothetical protein
MDSRAPKGETARPAGANAMLDVMRPGFASAEWASMTLAERVARCHAFAREASQLAQAAPAGTRQQYRDIAAHWNSLAAEMEDSQRDTPTRRS